jgi:23S rRNA (uracil1939-C5)-methyltransferase
MTYAEELRCKRARVSDALRRIGGVDIHLPDVAPSPEIEKYRNKAVFEAGRSRDGHAVVGFFRARSHDIVPVETCLIQTDAAMRAAGAVREWMDAARAPDTLVRRVFCRAGLGAQIAVVTRGAELPRRGSLVAALRERVPEAVSVLQIVSRSDKNVGLAGEINVLHGEDYLEDTLCGLTLRLSPRAFYQVNRPQAENLYAEVARLAELRKTDTALDLYCGAGAIALTLAGRAAGVYGAEISPEAVADARLNAARNNIANALFMAGDAGDAVRRLTSSGVTPDVVAVDPPRRGLHPDVIEAIVNLAPRRAVYVSCDPATLARDLRAFAERGYAVSEARALDMFPRCAHAETVAVLTRQRERA